MKARKVVNIAVVILMMNTQNYKFLNYFKLLIAMKFKENKNQNQMHKTA